MVVAVALVAGSVTLAVLIGQRMSTDAMAVVIGVVVGVAASIPTSLLVVAATRARREPTQLPSPGPDPRPPAVDPRPQIYVVTSPAPPASGSLPPWQQGNPHSILPPAGYGQMESARRFRVVGEDDSWVDDE
jgi:hypothetical protein